MTATTTTAFNSSARAQNPWTKLYILLTIAIVLTVYSIGAGAIKVPVWETVRTVFGVGSGTGGRVFRIRGARSALVHIGHKKCQKWPKKACKIDVNNRVLVVAGRPAGSGRFSPESTVRAPFGRNKDLK